jgi:Zn-dependent metalloprotease
MEPFQGQDRAGAIPKQTLESTAVAGLDQDRGIDREAPGVRPLQHGQQQRVKLVREENQPASNDTDADTVYEASGVVRAFLKNVLNRESIDNASMDMILNVHFGQDYNNPFWDGDEMTFGDGDGHIFVSFAKSLAVVAHELAHGGTQFTAGLDYYSQSGALNEHFSDVFGTAITQYDLNQTADNADWLIGNEIMGPTLAGETLRFMKAPGTAYSNALMGDDPQPAHMDDYFTGSADNQGVHINSGIPNRVFYRVATDQLGTEKAAKLWYRTLQRLWPTADFSDFVEVLIDTSRVLTGERLIPQGTTQTVRLALKEVGL